MSIEAYQAAWQSNCSGGVKLTLLAIAEFASKKNGYTCEAAVGTLADMVGTKPRQIERNIRELEEKGLLITKVNHGRGYTNMYSIAHLVKPVTQDNKPVTEDGFPIGNTPPLATGNPSHMTGINGENPSSRTENPSSRTQKPVTDDTLSVINQIEPKDNNENGIYKHPLPQPIADLITAMAKACKTPYGIGINEEEYEKAAYYLEGKGITPERVADVGQWWIRPGNGYYAGKPALKSLLQEIERPLEQAATAVPGNQPAQAETAAERAARIMKMAGAK